jgi:hypothetical protein
MFTKIKDLFKSLFKAEEPVNEAVATVEVPPVVIEAQKPAPKKQLAKPQAKKLQTKKPLNRSKKAK